MSGEVAPSGTSVAACTGVCCVSGDNGSPPSGYKECYCVDQSYLDNHGQTCAQFAAEPHGADNIPWSVVSECRADPGG